AWGGHTWESFVEIIGHPELLDDPRYATPADRSRNRAELNETIGAALRTRTTAEWIVECDARGIPAGAVYTVDELFADPQVEHLEMIRPVRHAELCELKLI